MVIRIMAHIKVTVVLFSLLCISTDIYATQSEDLPSQNITKLINNSIIRIFRSIDSEVIAELIKNIENCNATNFETGISHEVKPFNNKFYYSGINVSVLHFGHPKIHYDFNNDKLVIFNPEFTLRLEGYVGATKEIALTGFIHSVHFKNISITAVKPPENVSDSKFQIGITYDYIVFDYIYLPWFREDIVPEAQKDLVEKIQRTLPLVLLNNINDNENFLEVINRTFCKQMSKREIALNYPDFVNHEEKFYYLAQNVSSFHITLGNISVNGLTNFVSIKFDDTLGYPANILVIENIRGKAILSYDTGNFTVFELDFKTERISISVNRKMQSVFVEAQNHSVIDTKRNISLTESQSGWIMEGIGQAIAASTMPSMKICRSKDELSGVRETAHPLRELFAEISEKFHWSTINESYSQWTPFNGNYTTTKMAFDTEPDKYKISIHNLTLVPGLLTNYPYQVECYFFQTLKIVYYIEGNATGTIRLQNTTNNNTVDIEFQAQLSFADQIIKRKPNDKYEFKIWLAFYVNPVQVHLVPPTDTNCTLKDSEKLQIINKINETLISMTREIMLHNANPLLSTPLNLCTIPETILDDFLPPFGDYQAPYRVADGKGIYEGKHSSPKIYNITLSGLSHFDLVRIAFNKDDLSKFGSSSSEEVVGSFIEFPFHNVTGRMNFNDSSVKFNQLLLERLDEISMINSTSTGMVSLFPSFKYKLTPEPADPGFSCHDSAWIMEKVEGIVESSLSKKSDDLLYSIMSGL